MQKKTLITHYKKHLIMSKDYYTKAEVNKLLADQKEEILAIIPKFAKHQEFDLKIAHPGLLARNNEIERLRNLLFNNKLIELVPSNLFAKVFSKYGLENTSYSKPIVKWIGQKNLCPYLLDQLDEYYFLKRDNIDKKANYIFGIKNAAELRIKYSKNKDKLPTNYSIIDKIVQTLIDERKLLYEDQGYFEKFIKPDLENDNEDFPPEYYSGPFY